MALFHLRTTRAVIWSALEVFTRQGAQFVVGMVLARMVAPTDFGLVALILFFTSIAGLFVESGFGSALIQQSGHTREDESTVFWFNLAAGTVLALVLVVVAPWIADFYKQPRLVLVTWAMACNLWITAFLTVHTAILTKNLDFRTQMKASFTATVMAGFSAIIAAFNGAGVWALVVQILVNTVVNVTMIWWLHPWRPSFVFRLDSFKRLSKFGGFLLLSSLLDTIVSRVYAVLIGKIYTAHDLGIYNRAMTTRDFPQNILGSIFSRVAFPVFSSRAKEPVQLRKGVKDAMELMMAINLPLMVGLCVSADVLMPVLFGTQWSPSIPIFQILCGVGMLWPMHLANLNVLMAQGYSNLFLRLELVKKALLVFLIVVASNWGMIAIAWATVISSVVGFFVNSHYTGRRLQYSAFEQLRDIAPCAALAISMAGVLVILKFFIDDFPNVVQLALEVLVGISFYFSTGHVFGLKAFKNIQRVMRAVLEPEAYMLDGSKKA